MGKDLETVYPSGPAPPRQRRFPAQTRTTRPRRSSTRESMIREQSTLTQLDFCTPPPRSAAVEDTDEEDHGHERTRRARKRRRAGGKQTTMTQFYCSFGTDPGDELCELPDDTIEDIRPLSPLKDLPTTGNGKQDAITERPSSPVICHAAEPGNFTFAPQTPSKRLHDEVPSSQTPQSIYLTGRTRRQLYSPQRSPLKEKSDNIQTTPRYSQPKAGRRQRSTELPLSPPDRATFPKPAIPKLRHLSLIHI